jgi:glycosyltransferase involved in cell wall biosynthesis
MIQNLYPNDFHIDIDYEPNVQDANFLKQYQIIHIHRNIGHSYEGNDQLIKWISSLGITTVVDIDDYWLPGKEHPIHHIIVENKINERIVANLSAADYVTTTTTIFADEIKKHNKNVVIFPNAINPKNPQFSEPTLPSNKLRIGWLGGSSHLHDLMLMEGFVSKLTSINDKLQYVVCGFDTRGTVTEINKATGEQKQRPIRPEETVWVQYEKIFTDNYNVVSPEYKKFLELYKEGEYPNIENEGYRRVWTKPITTYAKNYSTFDISLAPIKNHIFNRVKSQLKVIEAGFYKKALIASNIGPYTVDLKHSLENGKFTDGNALLVNETNNHSDWAKYIKKLYDNPNMRIDMGERLYETVKDTYNLEKVSRDRAEWYKTIIK